MFTSEKRKVEMRDILIYFYIKYQKNWDKIYSAVVAKEKVPEEDLFKVVDNAKKSCRFITLIDNDYPERYKGAYKPPFVLEFPKEVEC